MNVGVIGLGTMGGRIVQRLIGGGIVPRVFDVIPAACARAAQAGAIVSESIGALVAASDIVLSSLPMPADVEAVYTGLGGAITTARSGHVFADLSTIDPTTARRLAEQLAPTGAEFLDAPVSGGPTGVDAGTLAIMIGGNAAAVDRMRPVLMTFAAKVIHVGPVGAGSVVKLANQLMVGVGTIAAMEAVTYATRQGIPASTVLEVLSASAGDSVMLRRSIRDFHMTGDFTPAFATRLLMKDLRLFAAEAESLGLNSPVSAPTVALFEEAMAAGLANEDYAAILKLIDPSYARSAD